MKPASAAHPCLETVEVVRPYLDGELPPDRAAQFLQHMAVCAKCKQEFETRKAVIGMLGQTFGARRISSGFDQRANSRLGVLKETTGPLAQIEPEEAALETRAAGLPLIMRLGGTPWWFVSVALHALVLLFVGLLALSIRSDDDQQVIVVTHLEHPPQPPEQPEEQKVRDILENPRVDSADPQLDQLNLIVPQDLVTPLADHVETPNDSPMNSAAGVPDSQVYNPTSSEDAGGGGNEGSAALDDTIGISGAGSKGFGGGSGGGVGTGFGTGKGSGTGGFGQRGEGGRAALVRRGGGGPATESAVNKGLEWLAKHQEEDGHWDARKHSATCAEQEWVDTGMTSIALLAFLGAGHSEKVGKYRDNVRRAVQWLVSKQKKEGALKGGWVTVMYANGMATQALAEAYGMAKNPEVKKAAQAGVEYLESAQHEYMAWDYYAGKDINLRNDTSVTGWQVMALKSARAAGLKVDELAFEGAVNWLNIGQDLPKDVGDVASDFTGGLMAYQGTKAGGADAHSRSLSMTAAAAMMRIFLGQKIDHPGILGPCNIMTTKNKDGRNNLPCRNAYVNIPNSGIDYYYWYYGTFATFQVGGDPWKKWNAALKETLLGLQRKDGDADGSWDPEGTGRIPDGGRVFSTALAVLSLEVYYRFLILSKH